MHFVYVIINVAILAAGLFLVARKSVVGMLRARREKLGAELDEAERSLALPELPPEQPADRTLLDAELDNVLREGEEALREQDRLLERAKTDRRREMLLQTRETAIDRIMESMTAYMQSEEYRQAIRVRKPLAVERILSRIHTTPGDMAYLTRSGVLYVTLTSSDVLDEVLVEQIRARTTELVRRANGEISLWVKQNPELIAGIQLRIGDTIYDYSIANQIYRMARALKDRPVTETDGESLIRNMVQAVKDMEIGIDVFQVGRVIRTSDGICWLDGVADIMYGELVEFTDGQRGMVMDIQPDRVGCIIFGRYDHVESYSRVRRLNVMASVPVGEAMLGRVVDALGRPIDGRGRIWTHETRPIECEAPAIPDRQSVSVPLHTGIKAIDALAPIGRGQRELIIGDRQTGKTAIAVDTILNQKGKNVVCIYVAIGQKKSTVAEIVELLEQNGAMEYTTVVSATASDSASLQYIAPFTGAAMSEYFMYHGRDVLIVYDDLSKHAVAYREISLLLHRPSGREAYPGDIFYLHSRLLERAARLNSECGGGSVTALPIIETQAGDISAYIPTNVISITDGQIFLDTDLFNEGQRPAVNVGLSVSRVGGAAQTGLMKQSAASLRTSLAQYRELAAFTQFGSDVDEATRKALAAGVRMMAVLRQDRCAPLEDWQQALQLIAVSGGYADGIEPEEMGAFASQLLAWFPMREKELTERLKTGKKLSPEEREALNAALARFVEAL